MKRICWLIALFILLLWGIARVMHPGNMNFPHKFFLLKYAGDIAFINFAVLIFVYPILLEKKLVDADRHGNSVAARAKGILVIYSIVFPGIFLICISGILAKLTPFYFIAAAYFAYMCKNAYIYFSKRGAAGNPVTQYQETDNNRE